MESANPHSPSINGQHRAQTEHHLLSGLISKGHCQDSNGGNLSGLDQPSDTGSQDARLAAACPSQDHGGLGLAIFIDGREGYCLALFWIEVREQV